MLFTLTQLLSKVIYTSRKSQGWLSLPHFPPAPRFALGQKPNVPRLFHTQGTLDFMTFALDKNPVCSMVLGSKLIGEPAKINPQGSGQEQ